MLKEGQYVQFVSEKDGSHREGLIVQFKVNRYGQEYVTIHTNNSYRSFRRLQMGSVVVLH
jgi:hypothetical protein